MAPYDLKLLKKNLQRNFICFQLFDKKFFLSYIFLLDWVIFEEMTFPVYPLYICLQKL